MFVVVGSKLTGSSTDQSISLPDRDGKRQLYKLEIQMASKEKIHMFFEKQESLVKWHRALVKATGDYRIEMYYEEFPNTEFGHGVDSVIYKGINRQTRQEVAIKKIRKQDRPDFH